jgi:hypothetical protein
MNKKIIIFFITALYFSSIQSTITDIFFDPNAVFETSSSKASGYVGKWEAMKYTAVVGRIPSQEDFFRAIMPVTATSSIRTYDETYPAPFIISDWLLGAPVHVLKNEIKNFLNNSNLSRPEKKVHMNTVNMMFDGTSLARVQKIRSKILKLFKQLKQKGYRLHFVGNWADIQPLKAAFPQIFAHIDTIYISSDIKQLKPQKEFWQTVWTTMNINPQNCLCIEAEEIFYDTAATLPCKTVLYHKKKSMKQFCNELQAAGISVSL